MHTNWASCPTPLWTICCSTSISGGSRWGKRGKKIERHRQENGVSFYHSLSKSAVEVCGNRRKSISSARVQRRPQMDVVLGIRYNLCELAVNLGTWQGHLPELREPEALRNVRRGWAHCVSRSMALCEVSRDTTISLFASGCVKFVPDPTCGLYLSHEVVRVTSWSWFW